MACDIIGSVARMREKIERIKAVCETALKLDDISPTQGIRYQHFNTNLARIALEVRDTMQVENYWYARFLERGIINNQPTKQEIKK